MSNQQSAWRKSSYSTNAANCVEVAPTPTNVLVRDSKHPAEGHIGFHTAELAALIEACEAGELDHLS